MWKILLTTCIYTKVNIFFERLKNSNYIKVYLGTIPTGHAAEYFVHMITQEAVKAHVVRNPLKFG